MAEPMFESLLNEMRNAEKNFPEEIKEADNPPSKFEIGEEVLVYPEKRVPGEGYGRMPNPKKPHKVTIIKKSCEQGPGETKKGWVYLVKTKGGDGYWAMERILGKLNKNESNIKEADNPPSKFEIGEEVLVYPEKRVPGEGYGRMPHPKKPHKVTIVKKSCEQGPGETKKGWVYLVKTKGGDGYWAMERILGKLNKNESNIKEADSLGKGPDKTPEMKGKNPDLANVNEEDDMTGDEEVDAYGRPNFPNPDMSEEEDVVNTGDAVEAAIKALGEWVEADVTPEQIKAVLWGIAMEDRNTDLVKDALEQLHAEANAAHEEDIPEEAPEEELLDKDECNKSPRG